MEEGRKSSLSYHPAALPKPFVPGGCASIGIIERLRATISQAADMFVVILAAGLDSLSE
jgi:hypothetical protein